MFNIEVTIFVVISVVAGLNEVIKKAVGDKIKDYIPAIAVATGIITAFGLQYAEGIFETIIIGGVIGLSSAGLYDNVEKIKKIKEVLKTNK